MRFIVDGYVLHFAVYARSPATCAADQGDLNPIRKVFGTGLSVSLKNVGDEQDVDKSSALNQFDASSFCAGEDSVFFERRGRSRTILRMSQGGYICW